MNPVLLSYHSSEISCSNFNLHLHILDFFPRAKIDISYRKWSSLLHCSVVDIDTNT